MTREELIEQIRTKKTFLCVGLDPDTEKIPKNLMDDEEDPIYEFNRQIIDATAPYCVAFKPNSAFYEAYGLNGISNLEKTFRYIRTNYPDHFLIADAKRGDIGNTSERYGKAFFKKLNADALTVNPYMGGDSVKPFLQFEEKWAIVLALTSNDGSFDFQHMKVGDKEFYMHVIEKCALWGTKENMMFVVGATRAEMLMQVRSIIPDHFLLVPGVGAQGGSLEDVCKYGLNSDVGLLVNSSRQILYASQGDDFAMRAEEEAAKIAKEMAKYL